jgi:hypothetical protein
LYLESDDDDWEGETHVSRILREYHSKNNTSLPTWLYDDRTPISALAMIPPEQQQIISRKESSRTRRLWQTSDELSSREKEIQALRSTSNTANDFSTNPSVLRSHSERALVNNVSSMRQRASYNTTTDQVFGSLAPRRNTTIRTKHYDSDVLPSPRQGSSYF